MVRSTSYAASFQQDGYVWIEQFLASDICQLASRYARMKQQVEPGYVDNRVPNFAYSVYGDTLMASIAEMVWPRIEALIDEPLWPTYTYYRVYETGAVLEPHIDRGSCEISTSICLGSDSGDAAAEDANWPLWVRSLSDQEQAFHMRPGDMVIYQGCDLMHWRNAYQGLWQVQVFLHFVRQNGPFASLAKFDTRPALGMPLRSRDQTQYDKLKRLERMRYESRHLRLPLNQHDNT